MARRCALRLAARSLRDMVGALAGDGRPSVRAAAREVPGRPQSRGLYDISGARSRTDKKHIIIMSRVCVCFVRERKNRSAHLHTFTSLSLPAHFFQRVSLPVPWAALSQGAEVEQLGASRPREREREGRRRPRRVLTGGEGERPLSVLLPEF